MTRRAAWHLLSLTAQLYTSGVDLEENNTTAGKQWPQIADAGTQRRNIDL